MTRIHEEFFTKARAEAHRTQLLRDFPAAKYGTQVSVVPPRRGEFWQCVGARFN